MADILIPVDASRPAPNTGARRHIVVSVPEDATAGEIQTAIDAR